MSSSISDLSSEADTERKWQWQASTSSSSRTSSLCDTSISSFEAESEPISHWQACMRSLSRTSINPAPSSSSNPHFEYVPLDATSRDIRLFSLFPADSFGEEIAGGLVHVSLDAWPVYETVSYVWGDPSISENMQLRYISSRAHPKHGKNDELSQPVPITANLALLLRHLRHSVIPRLLWIDSISINQYDNDEKGQQVQLMAAIYKVGSRSTIWLGEERAGTTKALRLIDRCVKMAPDFIEVPDFVQAWEAGSRGLEPSRLTTHYLTTTECKYVSTLFERRELWLRIWILQELVFAPQPVLMCGPESLAWDTLSAFLQMFFAPASLFGKTAFQHALLMDEQRRLFKGGAREFASNASLVSLLGSCRTFRSSNEKDMLFALLNVAFDRFGIEPDYNISAFEMWTAALKVLIRMQGQLIPFDEPFHLPLGDFDVSHDNLPSWVRFSCAENLISPEPKLNRKKPERAKIIDDERHYAPKQFHNQENPNELIVETIWLGTARQELVGNITVHEMLHTKGAMLDFGDFWYELRGIQKRGISSSLLLRILKHLLSSIPPSPNRSPSLLISEEAMRSQQSHGTKVICDKDCEYYSHWAERDTFDSLFSYRLETTEKGVFLMFPPPVKEGDQFHIVGGSPLPLVLRPSKKHQGCFEIISEAFAYLPSKGSLSDLDWTRIIRTRDGALVSQLDPDIEIGMPMHITLV